MSEIKIQINSTDKSSHQDTKKSQSQKATKHQKKKKFILKVLLYVLFLAVTITATWADMEYPLNWSNTKILYNEITDSSQNSYLNEIETTKITISSALPDDIYSMIYKALDQVDIFGVKRFEISQTDENPDINISLTADSNSDTVVNLLPVGHLYWVKSDVTLEEIKDKGAYISPNSEQYAKLLSSLGIPTEVVEDPLSILEESEDKILLITPKELNFKYKLLNYEDKYYLDALRNDEEGGSLTISITYPTNTTKTVTNSIKNNIRAVLKPANTANTSENVFTINQTGVTAITRKLTNKVISSKDGAYPANNIADFLADADLTHVSNEISFAPNCTNTNGMSFCAREETIDSLKLSGVDIVELTGNHNNDYGSNYNTSTINTYTDLGWDHFGGGLNAKDASKILYKETAEGKKVAFIGYNYWNAYFGFTGALAGSDRAGANPYDEKQMEMDIKNAKENAETVIVDIQFTECYSYPKGYVLYPTCYKSTTVPNQQTTFRKAIDFGADIVVGTQAHQPQTYEIYHDKVIYYGLGNLFFDQTPWPGTKHGYILTHYFIDGKYVQTKITTTNYESDLVTYISKGEERDLLLNLLKEAR